MFEESKTRSIVKAISWRVLATLITTLLVFTFTGRLDVALTVGAFEAVVKMLFYFLHERAWNRISVGRKHVQPSPVRPGRPIVEPALDGPDLEDVPRVVKTDAGRPGEFAHE